MRTVGLLLLALLIFPAFAHAAVPPALTTYTLSNATIYPSASVASGLATTTTIDIAFSEAVKTSIKIMSASGTLVKSLYSSSSVTNPTPKVWDGTNTAGTSAGNGAYTILISATSTATGLTMSNSSKTITIASPDTATSSSTDTIDITDDSTPSPATGAVPKYVPPPSALIVNAGPDVTALLEVPLRFSAQVKTKSGTAYTSARIIWNFGDGSSMEGTAVEKTYRYAGTYLVTATVTDGSVTDSDDLIVRVVPAQVHIIVIVGQGITIANDSNKRLDLSNWRLSVDFSSFRIPPGTQILPESSVLFPYEITRLPMSRDVTLWYPNGIVAARYLPAPVSDVQPTATSSGSSLVQTVRLGEAPARQVESVVSRTINAPAREMSQIAAPSATTQLAALGAALPDLVEQSPAEPTKSSTPALLRSPWTLGLIGVMLLAGAAFIFL